MVHSGDEVRTERTLQTSASNSLLSNKVLLQPLLPRFENKLSLIRNPHAHLFLSPTYVLVTSTQPAQTMAEEGGERNFILLRSVLFMHRSQGDPGTTEVTLHPFPRLSAPNETTSSWCLSSIAP